MSHSSLLAGVIHNTSEGIGIFGDFVVSASSLDENAEALASRCVEASTYLEIVSDRLVFNTLNFDLLLFD